jgi:hypothetical protein
MFFVVPSFVNDNLRVNNVSSVLAVNLKFNFLRSWITYHHDTEVIIKSLVICKSSKKIRRKIRVT